MTTPAASTATGPASEALAATTTTPPPPVTPNADTVKIVADLAARSYADERDRFKAIDTRIGFLLSAASAVTAIIMTILIKPPDVIAHRPLLATTTPLYAPLHWLYTQADALYFIAITLALLCLLWAQVSFVQAARQTDFVRPNLDYWVDYATLARSPESVQAELASTYDDLVQQYTHLNTERTRLIQRGAVTLVAGGVILAVGVAPVVIIMSIVQ